MNNRPFVLALCFVLASSGAALSAGKLTTAQIDLCGEDAAKLCVSTDNVDKARACLLKRIKILAPSCAYLLKRADIR